MNVGRMWENRSAQAVLVSFSELRYHSWGFLLSTCVIICLTCADMMFMHRLAMAVSSMVVYAEVGVAGSRVMGDDDDCVRVAKVVRSPPWILENY